MNRPTITARRPAPDRPRWLVYLAAHDENAAGGVIMAASPVHYASAAAALADARHALVHGIGAPEWAEVVESRPVAPGVWCESTRYYATRTAAHVTVYPAHVS